MWNARQSQIVLNFSSKFQQFNWKNLPCCNAIFCILTQFSTKFSTNMRPDGFAWRFLAYFIITARFFIIPHRNRLIPLVLLWRPEQVPSNSCCRPCMLHLFFFRALLVMWLDDRWSHTQNNTNCRCDGGDGRMASLKLIGSWNCLAGERINRRRCNNPTDAGCLYFFGERDLIVGMFGIEWNMWPENQFSLNAIGQKAALMTQFFHCKIQEWHFFYFLNF